MLPTISIPHPTGVSMVAEVRAAVAPMMAPPIAPVPAPVPRKPSAILI